MKRDGEFEQFVLTTEPGLRRALAGYMSRDAVSDALAEAFAYAWEHRDRVMRLEHPTGYLFRVAQSKARIRKQGFLPWSPVDATPDIEPDLVARAHRLVALAVPGGVAGARMRMDLLRNRGSAPHDRVHRRLSRESGARTPRANNWESGRMGELEDRLERLADHRAAQIPAYSMPPTDELAVRRRRVPRSVIVGIAACLAVALVIGGALLFSRSDGPSVQTPVGTRPRPAYSGCTGKAYVNNSGDDSLSVITTATNTVSGHIPVGRFPIGPALAPDGKHLYVSNNTDNTVSVIATDTDTVSGTITVGKGPGGITFSPDGARAYVAEEGSAVSVITTATGAVSDTVGVGKRPIVGAITADGKHYYITNKDDGTVSVVTTETGTVSATIPVGKGPGGVAVSPDGKHVYVANEYDGTVSVITTATGAVSAPITVGQGPLGITFTPDGKHAYVANNGDGTVSVITTATGAVSAPITIGSKPVGVTMSPDGKSVYVANNGDGTVSVITTATGAVSAPITVGNSPIGVSITHDGRHVYVANFGDGTVSMINTETNAVSAIIAAGRGPIDSAICPS